MSSLYSAISSTPGKLVFGALSALSFKNAYQSATAETLDSKFQRGLSSVMGDPSSKTFATARRVSEVLLWGGLGTVYGMMALAHPTPCPEGPLLPNDDDPNPEIGPQMPQEECSGESYFTTMGNGLSSLDDTVFFGAFKGFYNLVSNNPVTSGVTTVVSGVAATVLKNTGKASQIPEPQVQQGFYARFVDGVARQFDFSDGTIELLKYGWLVPRLRRLYYSNNERMR